MALNLCFRWHDHVKKQVCVGVNQSRQQCRVPQIDDVRIGWNVDGEMGERKRGALDYRLREFVGVGRVAEHAHRLLRSADVEPARGGKGPAMTNALLASISAALLVAAGPGCVVETVTANLSVSGVMLARRPGLDDACRYELELLEARGEAAE